jgi:hypothetical protein
MHLESYRRMVRSRECSQECHPASGRPRCKVCRRNCREVELRGRRDLYQRLCTGRQATECRACHSKHRCIHCQTDCRQCTTSTRAAGQWPNGRRRSDHVSVSSSPGRDGKVQNYPDCRPSYRQNTKLNHALIPWAGLCLFPQEKAFPRIPWISQMHP